MKEAPPAATPVRLVHHSIMLKRQVKDTRYRTAPRRPFLAGRIYIGY